MDSSSPDRWQRLESLFNAVVELSPASRSAFLDEHCGTDAQLRKELEVLLEHDSTPITSLQQPILEQAQSVLLNEATAGLTPGSRLAHYEIINLLGTGGMGRVYLAQDTRLGRRVAIKTLLSPAHQGRMLLRFEQEARSASALNHPNILTIFEFLQIENLNYIVSEFVDGITLRQKLGDGKIAVAEAIDIAIQLVKALAAAHASSIVHRDIKPENVIIRKDGIVKVVDFGIAKLSEPDAETLGDSSARLLSTQIGVVLGTAKYMSPEQARGLDVDARTDIFSTGAVIYEMLTGRPAFEGETRSDVIAAILTADPPELGDLDLNMPSDLAAVIRKALAKNRADRYQSMTDLLAALQQVKDDLDFEAKLRRTPGTSSDAHRRQPYFGLELGSSGLKKWAAVIVLLLIITGIDLYVGRARPHPAYATQHHQLAILPFTNLNQDPQTDFLGFSLADAIITKMGYISSLTVRPSSSVGRYRNRQVDPMEVAKELKVDTVLTGNFLKDGDQLRITTQLIDAQADRILWRDQVDVKYDKLLTVQDRVSQEIIRGLEVNLSPTEQQNLKPDEPVNTLAYEYYLRGVDFYALGDFPAAIRMLEKSATLDPNYALTWTQLGRAYTTNASLQFGGREQYHKAQAAYEKAVTLNPALIEPRIYMANLLTDTGRVEQAVPLLRAALQTNPNSAEAHWELGYAYRFAGMLPESIAEAERARQLDPSVKLNSSAINSYLYVGQYDKFLHSLPDNNSAYILFYRGLANYYKKDWGKAVANFDDSFRLDPNLLQAQVGKAMSYSISRENQKGIDLLRKSEQSILEHGVTDPEGIYKIAQAYAVLGDTKSALRVLQQSISGGFVNYPYFVSDPLLDNIRNEPQFATLMSEARQRSEHFRSLFSH